MTQQFVNLHVHTAIGSMLDSMVRVNELFDKCKELNQPAVAITDHGTCNAYFDLYKEYVRTGVKGIPGIEGYFIHDPENKEERNKHIVLLAQNEIGCKNIMRINYEAHKNIRIIYMKPYPRMTWELLEKYNEGIICLTACVNGIVARHIQNDDPKAALRDLERMQNIFKDRLYLEVQPHSLREDNVNQYKVNKNIYSLHKRTGIPMVATNDVHYLSQGDHKYHDMLLAVGDKKPLSAENRKRYSANEFYMKTAKHIIDYFGEDLGVMLCRNTVEVAERCENPDYLKNEKGNYYLPTFPVEEEKDYDVFAEWKEDNAKELDADVAYLRYKCIEKFKEFDFGDQKKEYWNRVKKEMKVFEEKNLCSYMLIVADYIQAARDRGCPVGPGRGCLTGDVNVYCGDGSVKCLKDINVGDSIVSHRGESRTVSNKFVYPIEEKLIKYYTYYGDYTGTTLTFDHKVFGEKIRFVDEWGKWADSTKAARKKYKEPEGKIEEIRAEDLNVGDWVFFPKIKREIEDGQSIDLTQYIDKVNYKPDVCGEWLVQRIPINRSFFGSVRDVSANAGVSRSFIKTLIDNGGELISKRNKPTIRQVSAKRRVEEYICSKYDDVKSWISDIKSKRVVERKIRKEIDINEEFLWVLGYFAADGWLFSRDGISMGFAFNSNDVDKVCRLANWLDGVGVYYRKVKHKTKDLIQVIIYSELLRCVFKDLFCDYNFTSQTKHFPQFVFKLPEDKIIHFLLGYIDGDGHFDNNKIKAATTSKKMAYQLKYLLQCLNIPSSIMFSKRRRFDVDSESYAVGFPYAEKLAKANKGFEREINYCKKYMWREVDGGFFCRIRKVEVVEGERFVYDVSVPEDASYLTTSGAVHNSSAGSIIAMILGITEIDPIKYGLMFERFVNPLREQLADIDTDFGDPEVVKQYLIEKYGREHVASIANIIYLRPKVVITDIVRSLELGGSKSAAFGIAKKITDTIPDDAKTVEDAFERSVEFKDYMLKYPEVYTYTIKLQNLPRQHGIHAAGVVISPKDRPLPDYLPLKMDKHGVVATQYDKDRVEDSGYLKVDTLGLSNLNTMDHAIELIKGRGKGGPKNQSDIPDGDKNAFDLISAGDTLGVFQLEASLAPLCKTLKPRSISEISDINALGRPGCPPEEREDYIKRKQGAVRSRPLHPKLKDAMVRTYHKCVYEEDLLALGQYICAWDLGRADIMRRICKGKEKTKHLLPKLKEDFVNDAYLNGVKKEDANKLFEIVNYFSGYGFNRSHSVCYSTIAYRTAYLKAHYTTEFLTALINSENPNSEKIKIYQTEIRSKGIQILPPDINKSQHQYSIEGPKKIRMGLSSIKGIGDKAIESIIENRPYKTIMDFVQKVNHSKVNKNVVTSLNKAGCFDVFNIPRKVFEDNFVDFKTRYRKAATKVKDAQIKKYLIGLKEENPEISDEEVKLIGKDMKKMMGLPQVNLNYEFPEGEEWPLKEKLENERAVLGDYMTGSINDVYGDFFDSRFTYAKPLDQLAKVPDGQVVRFEGVIRKRLREFKIKNKKSKNFGKTFGKYLVEDLHKNLSELTVWPEQYKEFKAVLGSNTPIICTCRVSSFGGNKSLALKSMVKI